MNSSTAFGLVGAALAAGVLVTVILTRPRNTEPAPAQTTVQETTAPAPAPVIQPQPVPQPAYQSTYPWGNSAYIWAIANTPYNQPQPVYSPYTNPYANPYMFQGTPYAQQYNSPVNPYYGYNSGMARPSPAYTPPNVWNVQTNGTGYMQPMNGVYMQYPQGYQTQPTVTQPFTYNMASCNSGGFCPDYTYVKQYTVQTPMTSAPVMAAPAPTYQQPAPQMQPPVNQGNGSVFMTPVSQTTNFTPSVSMPQTPGFYPGTVPNAANPGYDPLLDKFQRETRGSGAFNQQVTNNPHW